MGHYIVVHNCHKSFPDAEKHPESQILLLEDLAKRFEEEIEIDSFRGLLENREKRRDAC